MNLFIDDNTHKMYMMLSFDQMLCYSDSNMLYIKKYTHCLSVTEHPWVFHSRYNKTMVMSKKSMVLTMKNP